MSQSLLVTLADYEADPELPNLGLATRPASTMEMYGLTVPSKIVLIPLKTIWDDSKHIEKMVEMGAEYWK